MGGAREYKTQQSKVSPKGQVLSLGKDLRIHESAGEVHFHDDTTLWKVAIPVAELSAAWESIKDRPGKWEYLDFQRQTRLIIEVVSVENTAMGTAASGASIDLDVAIRVGKVTIGRTKKHSAFDDFIQGGMTDAQKKS